MSAEHGVPRATQTRAATTNVDRVRNILIGGQMRNYEHCSARPEERLTQEVARPREDMEARICAHADEPLAGPHRQRDELENLFAENGMRLNRVLDSPALTEPARGSMPGDATAAPADPAGDDHLSKGIGMARICARAGRFVTVGLRRPDAGETPAGGLP